ncbi:MAG: glycosyltransferase family 2 protein [Gammaproteobacteria bacterium]
MLGVSKATSDLLVFTDAATEIGAGSFRAMAGLLSDPEIGAVSSEDRFRSRDGQIVGEGLYVRFEMWLRRLESRAAGLVGLSGSLFATRRSICAEWLPHVCSDFRTGLACARQGLRAVSAPEVVGIYSDLKDPSKEYPRKKRTILRGMTGLAAAREILDFRRHGLFAFQVWSHKIMRWATPWFLLLLAVTSIACAPHSAICALAVAGQVVFYGLALLGLLVPGLRDTTLVRIPYYFVQVNLAMAQALIDYSRGRRVVVWQPSAR